MTVDHTRFAVAETIVKQRIVNLLHKNFIHYTVQSNTCRKKCMSNMKRNNKDNDLKEPYLDKQFCSMLNCFIVYI